MKIKKMLLSSMTVLLTGFAVASYAGPISNYYPPERIHCSVKGAQLLCDGFDQRYLIQEMKTRDLKDFKDKDMDFRFNSGMFHPSTFNEIFDFLYINDQGVSVRLLVASTDIRPDLNSDQWRKISEDLYHCKGGYMSCPITTLTLKS